MKVQITVYELKEHGKSYFTLFINDDAFAIEPRVNQFCGSVEDGVKKGPHLGIRKNKLDYLPYYVRLAIRNRVHGYIDAVTNIEDKGA